MLPTPIPLRPRSPGTGLIVVGGPVSSYQWSDDHMMKQIGDILARYPDFRWFLTTTMQTLPETERRLQALSNQDIFCIPHYEVEPGWLMGRLQESEQIWISEDSLPLIYQSLTAGAPTGVLPVPRRKPNREIAALEGLIVSFPAWQAGTVLHPPQPPFNEAARCATEIYQRWLQSTA